MAGQYRPGVGAQDALSRLQQQRLQVLALEEQRRIRFGIDRVYHAIQDGRLEVSALREGTASLASALEASGGDVTRGLEAVEQALLKIDGKVSGGLGATAMSAAERQAFAKTLIEEWVEFNKPNTAIGRGVKWFSTKTTAGKTLGVIGEIAGKGKTIVINTAFVAFVALVGYMIYDTPEAFSRRPGESRPHAIARGAGTTFGEVRQTFTQFEAEGESRTRTRIVQDLANANTPIDGLWNCKINQDTLAFPVTRYTDNLVKGETLPSLSALYPNSPGMIRFYQDHAQSGAGIVSLKAGDQVQCLRLQNTAIGRPVDENNVPGDYVLLKLKDGRWALARLDDSGLSLTKKAGLVSNTDFAGTEDEKAQQQLAFVAGAVLEPGILGESVSLQLGFTQAQAWARWLLTSGPEAVPISSAETLAVAGEYSELAVAGVETGAGVASKFFFGLITLPVTAVQVNNWAEDRVYAHVEPRWDSPEYARTHTGNPIQDVKAGGWDGFSYTLAERIHDIKQDIAYSSVGYAWSSAWRHAVDWAGYGPERSVITGETAPMRPAIDWSANDRVCTFESPTGRIIYANGDGR